MPASDKEIIVTYSRAYFYITFVDRHDERIGEVQRVHIHGNAQEPRKGIDYEETYQKDDGVTYKFTGWAGGSYTNVTQNATIEPVYIEDTHNTFAYVLKSEFIRPTNENGYSGDTYDNALVDEFGNKIPLTINVQNLTLAEKQAIQMKETYIPVMIFGQDNINYYLTDYTKEQLSNITTGVDANTNKSYKINWYLLKYQINDGWHLDGHKVYDETIITASYRNNQITFESNNAMTNVSVRINNSNVSVSRYTTNEYNMGNYYGNIYYAPAGYNNTTRTVTLTYTVNGIENQKEFTLKGNKISAK